MPDIKRMLSDIKTEIENKKDLLNLIRQRRTETPRYAAIQAPTSTIANLLSTHRSFNLLAQGDSWFDYPPGKDIIDCLRDNHSHNVHNIAVAGSTLNDEVYGPVPREMFGLPMGPTQSDDPSRIAELVHLINETKPDGLLVSAGGNDIAGDEFFSFINNALSGLPNVNEDVLKGVLNDTFKTAYENMVEVALAAAADINKPNMKIFTHGYDYPWPDGRGVVSFLGWRVGPWFDDTFNKKNYPNTNYNQLKIRHDIIAKFIDELNTMLTSLSAKYSGKVFHVDLRNTLTSPDDWANELHPVNEGFAKLAAKFDASIQANL